MNNRQVRQQTEKTTDRQGDRQTRKQTDKTTCRQD